MNLPATTFRRFPLVARPRPACGPLGERVDDLRRRAAAAEQDRDVTGAVAVFNLAALLASDCGLPQLARTWAHRLARATLRHLPQDFPAASHSLEPVVNLARLRTRAGDGTAAWTILETLYQAITTRTDTTIDGLEVPASRITAGSTAYRELRQWSWAVLLSTGARALTSDGHWDEAYHRLNAHKGIGRRMLDGRQIAVIAHTTTGRHDKARTLLNETAPGQPWENAVTACLNLLCQQHAPTRAEQRNTVTAYQALNHTAAGLAVFHTRLGLTVVDALGGANHPAARRIITGLIEHAGTDGYAARDLLTHPGCRSVLTNAQMERLNARINVSGLDTGSIPDPMHATLTQALDTAEHVITSAFTQVPTGAPASAPAGMS
jgi:hypothetical protein